MAASDNPLLSVVVGIVSDTTAHADSRFLEPCLEALQQQTDAPPMEIIVPYHPFVSGIAGLRQRFPDVRFVEVTDLRTYTGRSGSREHHDELRARGLAVARGSLVGLIEDHAIPSPEWSARMVSAHRQGFAAVGGAIENGVDSPLNWAVYFCDFLRYQNPLPEGKSAIASDANVTYKRAALNLVRSVWQETFHERDVNWALQSRGEELALAPRAVLFQNRRGLGFREAMKERYVWGRSYAATRIKSAAIVQRMLWAAFSPLLPILMLLRMALMAWKKRRTVGAFLKALPLTAALVVSWSAGEFLGYLTGKANAGGAPATQPLTRGSHAAS